MSIKSFRIPVIAAALAAAVALAASCSETHRAAPVATDIQTRISNSMHPALHGTVGEFAALIDASPMSVEGYGLVVGLANTGAHGDMDGNVRDMLLRRLLITGVGQYSTDTQDISPENILASAQAAPVEVRGLIPPLARKGSTFDLYINSLPGSGTTSLLNGLLWPGDLKQIGLNAEGHDTHTIAVGRGPVFIPAPLEAASALAAGKQPREVPKALLSGRVVAGGVVYEDRDARLQVYVNDAMRTRIIERAINARFPGRDKAAAAENDAIVSLHIPPEYADSPMDFVDLVRHLYLNTGEPGAVQEHARQILEALQQPGTPKRELGLALQGLGTSIIPDFLEPNYTSSNQELRFWCARAAACMQQVQGLVTLEEMVKDPSNPFRRQALVALVEASRGRDTASASLTFMDLLRSLNTDDRILAYHALLAIHSRAVATYDAGRKFIIDIVPADSPPLIYVLEADSPRIAFIGRPLEMTPGAIYLSKDKHLTVMADDPATTPAAQTPVNAPVITAASVTGTSDPNTKPKLKEPVQIYWRPTSGGTAVTLRSVAGLPSIVYRAAWIPQPDPNHPFDPQDKYIGASYQRMTEMLAEMCTDKVINATFVVQRTPDQIVSPTEIALSGRQDAATKVPTPAGNAPPQAADPGATPIQP